MRIKPFIFFIPFFFCCISAIAQSAGKDYVITIKGDTIAAKLKYNFLGNVVYKLNGKGGAEPVDDGNIKEYYWAGERNPIFRLIQLPGTDKSVFAAVLESGSITLYKIKIQHYRYSSSTLYAAKNSEPVVEVINQKQIFGNHVQLTSNFTGLINDKKQVIDKFTQHHKYNFQLLQRTVHEYNTGF